MTQDTAQATPAESDPGEDGLDTVYIAITDMGAGEIRLGCTLSEAEIKAIAQDPRGHSIAHYTAAVIITSIAERMGRAGRDESPDMSGMH